MAYGFNEDKTRIDVATSDDHIFKVKSYTEDLTFTNYYATLTLDTPTGYVPLCVKEFGASNPTNPSLVLNIVGLRFSGDNSLIINVSANTRRVVKITVIFIKEDWLTT